MNSKGNKKIDEINLLAPKIYEDNHRVYKEYEKRIDSLINNPEANNVAIAGSYGTGKSSVVRTYIKNKIGDYVEYSDTYNEYIIVSIGSFLDLSNHPRENSDSGDSVINDDEYFLVDKIEKSILKQIVYRNKEKEIENSNIRRLSKNKNKLVNFYIYVMTFLSILVFIIMNNITFFKKIIPDEKIELLIKYKERLFNILLFLILLYIIFLIKLIYDYICSNKKAKTIKIKDYEIEYASKDDLTFTKQLYEILLFFQNNNTKAVFFEDIDRFERDVALMVIEELKELNTILNSTYGIRGRNITFFYLFRDSIFQKATDRTKFYDYILTILPISTLYNSFYLFKLILQKYQSRIEVSDNLLKLVSKYVTDVRLINSIINDYLLLYDIFDRRNNQDTMFAMCVFKNCYATDYDKILNKNGLFKKYILDVIDSYTLNDETKEYYTLIRKLCVLGYITEKSLDYITSPIIEEQITFDESNFIFDIKHIDEYKLECYDIEISHCDVVINILLDFFDDGNGNKNIIFNYDLINYLSREYLKGNNSFIYSDILNNYKDYILDDAVNSFKFFKIFRENRLNDYIKFMKALYKVGLNISNSYGYFKSQFRAYNNHAYDYLNDELLISILHQPNNSLGGKNIILRYLSNNFLSDLSKKRIVYRNLCLLFKNESNINMIKNDFNKDNREVILNRIKKYKEQNGYE